MIYKFTKKRVIIISVVMVLLALVGFGLAKSRNGKANIVIETAVRKDLERTVLTSGKAVSHIDLQLSFKASGNVQSISAKVGSKVKAGQILATLDQKDQSANLTSARGALASAQANYDKIIAGASSEEVAVAQKAVDAAQVALDNTIKQQTVAVQNALLAMLNSGLDAKSSNTNYPATISGTYGSNIEGEYVIQTYSSSGGLIYTYSGLESGQGYVNSFEALVLGSRGLYISFPAGFTPGTVIWTVAIPNRSAATYVTNFNAYQSALITKETQIASAKAAYDFAVAALNLKKAQARPVDLDAARAQILSAQGQVQAALAALENTIIRSPVAGTVTAVDIKIGEQAAAQDAVITLQDVGNLNVEANVGEANIQQITADQTATVYFDALGSSQKYDAKVLFVDPASNLVSGVVNYKVTLDITENELIKPGMTANITIKTASRTQALAVPLRAIVNKNGKKFVRVITNKETKEFEEIEVTTGLESDGGMVEILSGMEEGTEIIISGI